MKRKKIKKIIKWTIWLIFMFTVCHALATLQRGYEAVGGEIFVFAIPLIYSLFKREFSGKENGKDA